MDPFIKCPFCKRDAVITYEENRVYKCSCESCKEIIMIQSTSEESAIAVPTLSERKRSIFKDNKQLYDLQQRNADILAQHILTNMNADLVTIVTGVHQVNILFNTKTENVDYIVYLHHFISSERNMNVQYYLNC